MKTVTVLVGNIASGKSSYLEDNADSAIISRDCIRKQFANTIDEDYIYDEYLERIIHSMIEELMHGLCYIGTVDIIIDETNMTKEGRRMFIEIAKSYRYKTKAIVFPDLGEDIHIKRRLKDNHGDISEETWREVYREKKERYEVPYLEEGFDDIIFIGSGLVVGQIKI